MEPPSRGKLALVLQVSLPNLDVPPALVAPVGDSPFRVKGGVANGLLQYIAENVPGGIDAVRRELEGPSLIAYLDQPFFTGSWYDFFPYLHCQVAAARAVRRPVTRFVAEHAAWQAKRDIRGVHRLLLLVASPEKVAPRMPVAFRRYFDLAIVDVLGVGPGVLDLRVHAIPAVLVDWYKVSVQSAAEAILGVAGARNVQSWYSPPEPDGLSGTVPLVKFDARRTWSR
jgi:hypothetical protein